MIFAIPIRGVVDWRVMSFHGRNVQLESVRWSKIIQELF
jgi:hypothetical protein